MQAWRKLRQGMHCLHDGRSDGKHAECILDKNSNYGRDQMDESHGETDFSWTQFFAGRGIPELPFPDAESSDYKLWERRYSRMYKENLICKMLEGMEQWSLVSGLIRDVIKQKNVESRHDYHDLELAQGNDT
ncbi:hypothetical protein J6590_093170 [Homalodisca vitripennis]|nr:hypothetical protein J6590_056686 [Homalodisca vitripennis]KAG8314413.1 hypothetical protein J6590_093170 [Homalodisca vitripennis]